jgi:pimeloyl-ACP methyl ester carboxylesterase
MLPLAVPLRRAGLNLLLFDARNHGRSDADSFSSLPRFAEDLGAALAWLKQRHPRRSARVAVLGHSVGAGAALFAASRNRDIAAVISIAAFADPAEVTARYLAPLYLPRWVTTLVIRYVEWVIGHRFDTIAPVRSIRQVTCPVLLMHGQADTLVPVEDARRILTQAQGQGARLLEVPGAGHDSVDRIEDHLDAILAFLRETGVLGPGMAAITPSPS